MIPAMDWIPTGGGGWARVIAVLAGAYGLGCVNPAYYTARWKAGVDIGETGSGNAGAINAGRLLGRFGLLALLPENFPRQGYDLALIAGVLKQGRIYRRLGFVPFGPVLGSGAAPFQPMQLSLERFAALSAESGGRWVPGELLERAGSRDAGLIIAHEQQMATS